MLYGNNGAAIAAHLAATDDAQNRLTTTAQSSWSDRLRLVTAIDKQEELRQLDQYLEQLNYNEQDHASPQRGERGAGRNSAGANQRRPEATSAFGTATRNKSALRNERQNRAGAN